MVGKAIRSAKVEPIQVKKLDHVMIEHHYLGAPAEQHIFEAHEGPQAMAHLQTHMPSTSEPEGETGGALPEKV